MFASAESIAITSGIWVAIILGIIALLFIFNKFTRLFVYIKNSEYGVVEKLWSAKGSVRSGFMALDKSAGFLPETLRGGAHFFRPFQYRIHKRPLITVRNIAYVFARDGVPLPAGQTLAHTPDDLTFEDARKFIAAGGQRGPQRMVVREGIYAFNLALFVVMTEDAIHAIDVGDDKATLQSMYNLIKERRGFEPVTIRDTDDAIGVVTVHDGPVLEHGAIIAPAVGVDKSDVTTFHNSYQDIEKFLTAGGCRGRQEQPLVEGTYYINRLFATVELKPKTPVGIGNAGVVVSYTGNAAGKDVSGDDYKHGTLVKRGERGVWAEPLPPGKYPFNPYAYSVVVVPTTNFVLRWIKERSEDHGLDANLAEIRLITNDGFEPILPLSLVVHISPENAPRLIQQFADVKKLVDQTIDPMVSAYFKDAAQSMTMLELIQKRAELQAKAKAEMKTRFAPYNIEIMEVLIGTPKSDKDDTRIKALLDQIRDRQLAAEQKTTYTAQSLAATEKQKLNEAEANANQQTALTESNIEITVSENKGKAALRLREQEAEGIKIIAEAEAYKITAEGNAQAARTEAIGKAEGAAIKAQVEAYEGEGGERKLRQAIAEVLGDAIKTTKQPLVPTMVMTGSGEGKQTSMVEGLLALVLADHTKTVNAKVVQPAE